MNLRHLETFVAIADSGSFAAAADRVGVTQSAVSMQMKALEDQLQAELFDRAVKPPSLNETGFALLPKMRILLRQADELRMLAGRVELRGRLRIGTIPTTAATLVPQALQRLSEKAPSVQLRVESGLSSDLVRRVQNRSLDGAIVTETPRLERGLSFIPILEEPLVLVAHDDISGQRVSQILRHRPFIRFNRRTGVGQVIDGALRRRRIAVQETMELDSIEAILAMVHRGLGVAIAPLSSVLSFQDAALQHVALGTPNVTRRVGLIVNEKDEINPVLTALLEELRDLGKAY